MSPSFIRIYRAVDFTIEYLEIGRIRNHFDKYSGEVNLKYIDDWVDITKRWHGHMKDEINQNIYGSKPDILHEMFGYLKGVLSNWRFQPGIEGEIEYLIDEENDKIIIEYEKQIAIDEDKFRTKVDFTKGHEPPTKKTEYDVYWVDGKSQLKIINPNSWFYENRNPKILDKKYLPDYLKLVFDLFNSFRSHAEPYVERYDKGLITGVHPHLIQSTPTRELPPPSDTKKIKANLKIAEIAYLFKILRDHKLIEAESLAELGRFIAANFYNKLSDDFNEKNIINILSNIDKDTADSWVAKFKELQIKAQKFYGKDD